LEDNVREPAPLRYHLLEKIGKSWRMLYNKSFSKYQAEMLVHYHTVFCGNEVKSEVVKVIEEK
jgi:hypothetical protein